MTRKDRIASRSAQEGKMNVSAGKKKAMRFLIFALLLILLLGTGHAVALEKANSLLQHINSMIFYETDSLPKWIEGQVPGLFLKLYPEGGDSGAGEDVLKAELTYVSGEKQLMDMISFELDETVTPSTVDMIWFNRDRAHLVAGELTARVHLESKSYFLDEEFTLHVVPYEDLPILQHNPEQIELTVAVGDTLRAKELGDAWLKLADGIGTGSRQPAFWDNPSRLEGLQFSDTGKSGLNSYAFCVAQKKGTYTLHLWQKSLTARNGELQLEADVSIPVIVTVANDAVLGPANVAPGASAQYAFSDDAEKVSWQAEGDGAAVSESGLLSIAEGTPLNSPFRVVATRLSDGTAFVREGTVMEASGLFDGVDFSFSSAAAGFIVSLPRGSTDLYGLQGQWTSSEISGTGTKRRTASSSFRFRSRTSQDARIRCALSPTGSFSEKPEAARMLYDRYYGDESARAKKNIENWRQTEILIAGHPARLVNYTQTDKRKGAVSYGEICYTRNNLLFTVQISLTGMDDTVHVTTGDLMELAARMDYDETQAPFTEDKVSLTVSAEGGTSSVSAGGSLAFAAAFADPEAVNAAQKNNGVTWSVTDAATGEATKLAKISKDGILTVGKKVPDAAALIITAVSDTFGTTDSLRITLVPAVSKLIAEPASLTLYAGTEKKQTVKISAEPASALLSGLTWNNSAPKVIEISELGNGSAEIAPLSAGKASVTVKEGGGRSVKLSVSVLAPVESLELTAKGKMIPGGTVTFTPVFTPAKPGDKTVQWTLNVGAQTASINAKGQLKISKDAAPGTVIRVTCTALGAPEPISAAMEITVEQK